MVTIADVAKRAGVSPKTVSNVLNGYKYLRPETKSRVEKAIEDLDYRVNLSARGLRSGRTGLITLALPDLRQSYFGELTASIVGAAKRRDLRVLIEQTDGDHERELELLQGPNRDFTDGTILSPVSVTCEELGQVELEFPLILLGERVLQQRFDSVTLPNQIAARAVTEHLLARGCSRILFLGAAPDEQHGSATLREHGYEEAIVAAGLPLDAALKRRCPIWRLASGAEVVSDVIESGTRFDAVFAANDSLAIGAMQSLHAHGMGVPEDVAVAGIDNIEDAAFTSPSLTSIAIDMDEYARNALALLDVRMKEARRTEDFPRYPVQHVFAPFELIARESTARP